MKSEESLLSPLLLHLRLHLFIHGHPPSPRYGLSRTRAPLYSRFYPPFYLSLSAVPLLTTGHTCAFFFSCFHLPTSHFSTWHHKRPISRPTKRSRRTASWKILRWSDLIFNYYVMLKRSSFKNTEAEITSVEYWLIHQLAWSNERAFAWRIRDARALLITIETITYMSK